MLLKAITSIIPRKKDQTSSNNSQRTAFNGFQEKQ